MSGPAPMVTVLAHEAANSGGELLVWLAFSLLVGFIAWLMLR